MCVRYLYHSFTSGQIADSYGSRDDLRQIILMGNIVLAHLQMSAWAVSRSCIWTQTGVDSPVCCCMESTDLAAYNPY